MEDKEIKVLYFAGMKEHLNKDSETISTTAKTLKEFLEELKSLY